MQPCPGFSSLLRLWLGLALAGATLLRADEPAPEYYPPLTPPQLEQLLGPIALYPDPLIALILPASTSPADVVLSARFLAAGGDPIHIDGQPWSDSIKALARYPAIIRWMDENLQWTQQLGNAVLTQPAAVMDAIQRLRARARASGALFSTPQQEVLVENEIISILPVQSDAIYVPYYDAEVVYASPGAGYYYPYGPYVTFGVGFSIGYWLNYDCDWHHHAIVVGDRHHNWQEHRDWNHHAAPGDQHGDRYNSNWHAWKAPAVHAAPSRPDPYRTPPGVSRPKPFPGSPSRSPSAHSPGTNHSPSNPNGRDSDHNRPPSPAPGSPPGKHDDHDRPVATPPPAPRPVSGSTSYPVPRPSGQSHPAGPVPTSGPTVSHDSHDRGPPMPSPAPRPESVSMPVNSPRSSGPTGTPSSTVMAPRTSPPPMPSPSAMAGPSPAMPAPRPVAAPSPPPANNSKDITREQNPESAR